MKNYCDKNNKIFVLPEGGQIKQTLLLNQKIAVIVNLYYLDTVDIYIPYIDNIPSGIFVYIYSSNSDVIKYAEEKIQKPDVFFILKENRGRDISALLVAASDIIKKYEYVCFLHDKKAKHDFLEDDLELWVKNLWGNMLYSEEYILQSIKLLKCEGYGVLLPPKPIGDYMDAMYIDPWNNDYDYTVALATKLGLNIQICEEDTAVVSLGTVFWCRTDALKNIFDYGWKYEDFPEEPMPDDGTISHAIERIFGFAALDSGYKVGTIINVGYASELIKILQKKMEDTYSWLWENVGVKNTYQLSNFNFEKSQVEELFSSHVKMFLYGAGFYGEKYLERLNFWGYKPFGFVVSDGCKKEDVYLGYPVYQLSQIDRHSDYGILICTNPSLQEEIAKSLDEKGYTNYFKAVVV